MTITTERTICTWIIEEDIPDLLPMYFEPDANKFIAPLRNKPKDFYPKKLQQKIRENSRTCSFWTVRLKETGTAIGTINLNPWEPHNILHIGAHLKRQFWNQGFGKELFTALIHHAFHELKLDRIHAIVEEGNDASLHVLQSCGLQVIRNGEIDGEQLFILQLNNSPE